MQNSPFRIRDLAIPVYLPVLFYNIGYGAIIPILAANVISLGGSVAQAAIIIFILSAGTVIFDIPAGKIATKFGEQNCMIVAGILGAFFFLLMGLSANIWVLGIVVFLQGCVDAVFMLARQTYITNTVPAERRARSLSTLGGVMRIGIFVGPLISALIVRFFSLEYCYFFAAFTALIAFCIMFLTRKTAAAFDKPFSSKIKDFEAKTSIKTFAIIKQNWRVLLILGLAILGATAVRGARSSALPLWGEHISLDAFSISLAFGISGFFDTLLFYPSGKIMDKYGRMFIAVPTEILMAAGIFALTFANNFYAFIGVAALLGIANGIGTGIVMSLGADIAPPQYRTKFLSIWRLIGDIGGMLGPGIITLFVKFENIPIGLFITAVIALFSAFLFWRYLPEFSKYANLRKKQVAKKQN